MYVQVSNRPDARFSTVHTVHTRQQTMLNSAVWQVSINLYFPPKPKVRRDRIPPPVYPSLIEVSV